MKTTFLLLSLASLTLQAAQPNIILILADDLGYQDLSIQGCKDFQTPHIDQLFKDGIQFNNGYVSNSVCAPSRAGLITGKSGSAFGFEANIPASAAKQKNGTIGLDPKEKTIADVLKSAGYRTMCLGKWHLGYNDKLFHPNKRGFDTFYGMSSGSRSYKALSQTADPIRRLQHNGTYIDEKSLGNDFYLTDHLTDMAVQFIQTQRTEKPDQPFFMFLSYTAPHGPMQAKEADLKQHHQIKNEMRRTYAGMVTNMDSNIGRIRKMLTKLGIAKNTLLVFLSDNGGPLAGKNWSRNGPLRGSKGSLWEGGIHVPFAICWPGTIKAGGKQNNMISSLDLLPTFAAAAGNTTLPEKLDGIDLLPALTGKSDFPQNRQFFWRRGKTTRIATRQGVYKFYRERKADGHTKDYLFDLSKDLREKNNLAKTQPERLAALLKSLATWEKSIPQPAFSSGYTAPAKLKKKKRKQP